MKIQRVASYRIALCCFSDADAALSVCYWPAQWASIVLLAGVCCLSVSSVGVCNPAGGWAGRPRGRSGGRHCTAGQYRYVPLGRHLVSYVTVFINAVWRWRVMSRIYTGWAKKAIPLVHYITLYERYHFFGPPCRWKWAEVDVKLAADMSALRCRTHNAHEIIFYG